MIPKKDKIICAIHQPNFFPWLGYFEKIKQADIFIFLDAVDYPGSGSGAGSWSSRVLLNIQGKAQWVGCAIQRDSAKKMIKEVKTSHHLDWRKKILKTIQANYAKRRNYRKTMELLVPLIENKTDNLSEYNINAIENISQVLNLKSRFVRQSDFSVEGKSTELLINLSKAVNANAYLCGGGANGYQEDALFSLSSLDLIYQNFEPTLYGDPQHFIKGLSVIDYLMEIEW